MTAYIEGRGRGKRADAARAPRRWLPLLHLPPADFPFSRVGIPPRSRQSIHSFRGERTRSQSQQFVSFWSVFQKHNLFWISSNYIFKISNLFRCSVVDRYSLLSVRAKLFKSPSSIWRDMKRHYLSFYASWEGTDCKFRCEKVDHNLDM